MNVRVNLNILLFYFCTWMSEMISIDQGSKPRQRPVTLKTHWPRPAALAALKAQMFQLVAVTLAKLFQVLERKK